jgi:hypothetical protein
MRIRDVGIWVRWLETSIRTDRNGSNSCGIGEQDGIGARRLINVNGGMRVDSLVRHVIL